MLLPGNTQALGRRAEQQDAFALSDLGDAAFCAHSGALCVVCDGMGGHAAGGEASRAAVAAFLGHYSGRDPTETIEATLLGALQSANAAVLAVAATAGDSGSTLVAAVLHDGLLRWISVGDSRLLLLREGRLHRVNHEHRYRSELLREAADGALDFEQARSDPQGELLTSSLGEAELPQVDRSLRPLPLHPQDQIYLLTDGLYRTLDEAALLATAIAPDGRPHAPEQVCAGWAAQAIGRGQPDQDNLTVAGLAWMPEGPGSPDAPPLVTARPAPQGSSSPPASQWPVAAKLGLAVAIASSGMGGLFYAFRGTAPSPPTPAAAVQTQPGTGAALGAAAASAAANTQPANTPAAPQPARPADAVLPSAVPAGARIAPAATAVRGATANGQKRRP